MENTVVKIDNLVKRYSELIALDHFSLEIKEGEIFGLLGPNGSGKTTTISCLLSLLSYDKGEIEVFGKPTSKQMMFCSLGTMFTSKMAPTLCFVLQLHTSS